MYTHKLTGQRLKLKKDYGTIGVFYLDRPHRLNIFADVEIKVVICNWKNIQPYGNAL